MEAIYFFSKSGDDYYGCARKGAAADRMYEMLESQYGEGNIIADPCPWILPKKEG